MDDQNSDAVKAEGNAARKGGARAVNRRKMSNVLRIEPDFKRRQMVRVLSFAGTYVALSTLVLGFFYVHIIHPEVVTSRPFYLDIGDAGAMWQRFPGLRTTVLIWATCTIGMSSLFAAAVGLHFSHKLAGPLYRFKKELLRIVDGEEFRPIALRKGDDFQDMADVLNQALAKLKSRAHDSEAEPMLEAELDRYRGACAEIERQLEGFDADGLKDLTADQAARSRDLIDGLRVSLAKCETAGSLV